MNNIKDSLISGIIKIKSSIKGLWLKKYCYIFEKYLLIKKLDDEKDFQIFPILKNTLFNLNQFSWIILTNSSESSLIFMINDQENENKWIYTIQSLINFEIEEYHIDNYKFIKKLGSGFEGNVYLYKNLINNEFIVFKIFQNYKNYNNELEIYNFLNFQYFIKKKIYLKFLNYYLIGLEYFNGIDLRTILRNNLNFDKIKIIKQIIQCLSYLHSNDIIYCDLKPENILIDQNNHIKLIDFGLSIKNKNLKKKRGTLDYMAPELFLNNQFCNEKIDIWSLGILIFEIFYKILPFSNNNYKINFPINSNFKLNKLILNLLNINPLNRPNIFIIEKKINKIVF